MPTFFRLTICFLWIVIGLLASQTARAQPRTDPDFDRYKQAADDCFRRQDYLCARKNYQLALVIKDNDPYCQNQLFAIEKAERRDRLIPKKVWDKTFGGSDADNLQTLIATSDGGFLLGGYSSSPQGGDKSKNSRGKDDFWVVKVDATGRKLWDKTFGGSDLDRLNTLVATLDGGFLLGGRSSSPQGSDKSENSRGKDDFWVVKIK